MISLNGISERSVSKQNSKQKFLDWVEFKSYGKQIKATSDIYATTNMLEIQCII